MGLNEDYKKLFDNYTKQENSLAEKYAKYTKGREFKINDKIYKVVSMYPEDLDPIGGVEVRYILNSPGSPEISILEKDLDDETLLFNKKDLIGFLNKKKEFDDKIKFMNDDFRSNHSNEFDWIENEVSEHDLLEYEEDIDYFYFMDGVVIVETTLDRSFVFEILEDGRLVSKDELN